MLKIFLVVLLIVGGIFIYYFHIYPVTSSPTKTDSNYKIAYISGDGIDQYGIPTQEANLWIMNQDGSNKRQVTKSGFIYSVHGWSPDNKNILIVQEKLDPQTKIVKQTASVVEVSTGNIKALKELNGVVGQLQYQWIDNNEVLINGPYSDNFSKNEIEKLDLAGNEEFLLTIPNDISILNTNKGGYVKNQITSDLNWLAFDREPCCDDPYFSPQLYSYNLKDKTLKLLSEGSSLQFMTWNQGKVLFTKNQDEIWKASPDGSEIKQIFKDNEHVKDSAESSGVISDVKSSLDGNYLLYDKNVGWQIWYLYNLDTNQKSQLVKQEFNKPPKEISLSPDDKFIVYDQQDLDAPGGVDSTQVCYTKFILENRTLKTTNERCASPMISN